MASKIVRCDRCKRRCRSLTGWNATLSRGVIVGYLCPTCQTPAENAEAEVNEATLDYGAGPLAGRIYGRPKAAE